MLLIQKKYGRVIAGRPHYLQSLHQDNFCNMRWYKSNHTCPAKRSRRDEFAGTWHIVHHSSNLSTKTQSSVVWEGELRAIARDFPVVFHQLCLQLFKNSCLYCLYDFLIINLVKKIFLKSTITSKLF